jgi:hypothetical protein
METVLQFYHHSYHQQRRKHCSLPKILNGPDAPRESVGLPRQISAELPETGFRTDLRENSAAGPRLCIGGLGLPVAGPIEHADTHKEGS